MKLVNINGILAFAPCMAAVLLAGCGGGAKVVSTIGGTVYNLLPGTTVTLLENGGNSLQVTNNAATAGTPVGFTFPGTLEAGNEYIVTVDTANLPLGQTCTVVNGIGVVEQATGNVNGITIQCLPTVSANNYVQGTITGLASGAQVTLENNGTDKLTVTGNGQNPQPFSFVTPIVLNGSYSVVVSQQPSSQTCTVSSGSATGKISAGTVPNVAVSCQ